jgi:hypothetical protein
VLDGFEGATGRLDRSTVEGSGARAAAESGCSPLNSFNPRAFAINQEVS